MFWLFLGYDCGVFTCFFADFISRDYPLCFNQMHIPRFRNYLGLQIIENHSVLPQSSATVDASSEILSGEFGALGIL